MAMEGTVKLPVFGTVRKKTAAGVGIGSVVLVLAVWYYRQRKASQAAASSQAQAGVAGTVTDPAGNVCSAVNPATGYCPGTPQDLAAQQQGTAAGFGYGFGAGGSGSPLGLTTGPAPVETTSQFATNAAWAQASEARLGSNGADATAAALSKYLLGQQITTTQEPTVEEAIAVEGYPPVAGANGYPPSMNVVAAQNPPPSSGTVTVPNVVGQTAGTAHNLIVKAGLSPRDSQGSIRGEFDWKVGSTVPAAGTQVATGSTVEINAIRP